MTNQPTCPECGETMLGGEEGVWFCAANHRAVTVERIATTEEEGE